MRRIRNGKPDKRVMKVIESNYRKLKDTCGVNQNGVFSGESIEDIFHDTIQFVCQDSKAASFQTDNEILEYFNYRFRMIKFQRIKDSRMLKEIEYADH